MSDKTTFEAVPGERKLKVTRTVDAPRELVWEMFSKPEYFSRWYGPREVSMPVCEMDFRAGGQYRFVHRDSSGQEIPCCGEYLEIEQPSRFVSTFIVDIAPFNESHTVATRTFQEQDGQTLITLESEYPSVEARDTAMCDRMQAGTRDILNRLDEILAQQQGHCLSHVGPVDENTQFSESESEPSRKEVVVTRIINAPRELVFKAWTEAKHIQQWWSPDHFSNPRCEADARPGGSISLDMQAPDGTIYPMGGTYHEVSEPERIVMTTTAFFNAEGNPELEVLNTVTFEELDGKTRLTLRAEVQKASSATAGGLAGMECGWSQSLVKLDHLVSGTKDREIIKSIVVDAPRELIYEAWTNPTEVMHWWGPNGFTNTIQEMDVQPGGKWLLVMHGPDGTDYPNESIYRDVNKPDRVAYDHLSGHFFHMAATFVPLFDKTEVTARMLFPSVEERNTFAEAGASEGLGQSLARLQNHVAGMKATD